MTKKSAEHLLKGGLEGEAKKNYLTPLHKNMLYQSLL